MHFRGSSDFVNFFFQDSFSNNPTCRLINPAKSSLGHVSKQILEEINDKVRAAAKVNQWKNIHEVINWFRSLQGKQTFTFVVFDIVNFYPSISEKLLTCALDYASKFTTIHLHEREAVMHARKPLLFDSSQPWTKRNNTNMFDATMGSLDGAEVCELVGLFILDKLTKCFANQNIGLYRDDGLAVFRNMGPITAEKIKKRFVQCFGDIELKITVQSNMKVVNYLDITLNLSNGKFYPYRKPNDKPLCINTKTNHPPSIIKQLPSGINKRISSLSCNAE